MPTSRVPRDESVPSEFFPGQGEDRQYRRVRISPQDAKDCGLWINCPGCRAIRDNKSAANHTDECRTRIEEMLSKKKSSKMDLSDERATTLLAQQGKIILEGEEKLKQLHKKVKDNETQADKRPRETEQDTGNTGSSGDHESKKAKQEEQRGTKRSADKTEVDTSPSMDTNQVDTLNLNTIDLGSKEERMKIKQAVKQKRVQLILFNERVNRVIVNQAAVDSTKNAKEAQRKPKEKPMTLRTSYANCAACKPAVDCSLQSKLRK